MNMVGMLLPVLIFTLSAGSAGWAQSVPAQSDDSRYTFKQVDGGYLRLDGRSGQVSICTPRAAGWACQEGASRSQSGASRHGQAGGAHAEAGRAPAIAERCRIQQDDGLRREGVETPG